MDSVVAQIETDITAINTPEDNTEKDTTESKEDSKDKKEE